ncbi:hypothetical protein [Siccirubricoccus deserti]|uniref:Uncharacterized protein n=1 Tax=Siccirubricoccus deserti TaxID=2013562 RepID=A0A9X0QYR2_9PROT|nr:hypothetical protein [Siccirubricoccus deserti]MBC4016339.1 hypothetical protein [Siccirubricoccus deserti]
MNMPEVNTPPLMDTLSEAQQAGVGRRGTDKQAAAHRLRARGFSYRRIAETLRIRYDIVSRWMYGDPPRPPAETPPISAPLVTQPVPLPGPPGLEQRLTALEATLSRFEAEAARREERLLAELGALRAALEASSGQASGRFRVLPWPHSGERA